MLYIFTCSDGYVLSRIFIQLKIVSFVCSWMQLMEMRKKRGKSKDSETPPAPSINGSNDSNSSDMPSLSSSKTTCRSISEPVVNVPIPQSLPPLLPHGASPSTTPLFETESSEYAHFFCPFPPPAITPL